MLTQRIAIDATKAAEGMYVAMLDRPWLETPFVFQGFEIRDRGEIELLQAYCSTIYVDVDRSSLTPAQIRMLAASRPARKSARYAVARKRREPGKWWRRLRNLLLRRGILKPRGESRLEADGYPVTSSVRAEAPAALAAYRALCDTWAQAFDYAKRKSFVKAAPLRRALRPVIDSVLRNPDAMAWTVFSRKGRRSAYSRPVGTSVWCVLFGRHLGFDRPALEELALGGLLLDIGYARLPAEFLEAERALNPAEFALLARHVELGAGILANTQGISQDVRDMVASHHERADGSGYPRHLRGNAIPVYGRIAGIADAYDAMTTENAYSPAYSAFDVARTLNEMRGKEFAAEVVEQFLRTVGMFPTGSIVELSNGMIGLVLEQNRQNALRPKVLVLLDEAGNKLPVPKVLEMRDLPLDTTHARAVWVAKGHEHGAFGIDPINFFNDPAGGSAGPGRPAAKS